MKDETFSDSFSVKMKPVRRFESFIYRFTDFVLPSLRFREKYKTFTAQHLSDRLSFYLLSFFVHITPSLFFYHSFRLFIFLSFTLPLHCHVFFLLSFLPFLFLLSLPFDFNMYLLRFLLSSFLPYVVSSFLLCFLFSLILSLFLSFLLFFGHSLSLLVLFPSFFLPSHKLFLIFLYLFLSLNFYLFIICL